MKSYPVYLNGEFVDSESEWANSTTHGLCAYAFISIVA